MTFALKAVLVFCIAWAVDVAYTFYIRRTAEGRAIQAALWSGLIAVTGAMNILAYTADRRLIVPMVLGYVAGTYWAVLRDR